MNKKMDFDIRPLTAKDIFPLAKIISLCGISDLKKCFANVDDNYSMAGINITIEITSIICENIENCKKELMQFISDLSGIEQNKLEALPPAKFIEIIKTIIKKDDFRDFFMALSELF